ncbi:small subunit ribosomal protein S17e [Nematocida parisii]|uniref:Ribosomal protein S17 n=1 Tax=Nematocida parisii (strain ERTm3) TaxID=935791 RepID=I3EHG4_NEMP3|nr:ribosomal protein S17 [Nematocida parisii ERTm1]EIJ88661.1 ribosomal protein S17 [Nematocida parisii ERTm3]KAI5130009.1 small subunit ribosomal protein S17e [Nematocida parisii]KAI5165107.1 small subunit ribosomal protein S17e [Nematocida sp. AWRm79]KAI5182399.1 small subunit ribosomal protein S17e [Nematocida sp. AWRm78]OAG30583.1 small subunit ribosomal protein S17e [Nematocida sp. ERTm5]|eukprot:XP_013058269.1 ribosomal protein S17 [Nematocida parisii ERTm1]
MGRVSSKLIKNASKQFVEKHYGNLTIDFYENRDVLDTASVIKGKKVRNKIAGYATRLMKRIRYEKVKGVSIRAQEEERERNENYVPSESIIDVERIEVDSVTMDMIKEIGLTGSFFVPSLEA